jgi:hypothetical protein
MLSTEYNRENYGKSYGIVSTLRMKSKAQVIKVPGSSQSDSNRKTLSHSMSSLSFQGPDVWGRLFDSTEDTYRPYFEAFAIENKSDPETEPVALISNLPKIIKQALGEDIPVQVIDKFVVMASKVTRSDRIGFEKFR